jgi:hypothetical protein
MTLAVGINHEYDRDICRRRVATVDLAPWSFSRRYATQIGFNGDPWAKAHG